MFTEFHLGLSVGYDAGPQGAPTNGTEQGGLLGLGAGDSTLLGIFSGLLSGSVISSKR